MERVPLLIKGKPRVLDIFICKFWCDGFHGFPNEIDPMMPSTWLPICARCQTLVRQRLGTVRLLHWLTNRRVGGQVSCWKPIVSWRAYSYMGSSPNPASKMETSGHFPCDLWSSYEILYNMKVKIHVLINWSYISPHLCWLLHFEWLS